MEAVAEASSKNEWTDFPAAHLDDLGRGGGCLAQQPEDGAGEVALERAQRFQPALASLLFAAQVRGRERRSALGRSRSCAAPSAQRPTPAVSPMILAAIRAPQPLSRDRTGAGQSLSISSPERDDSGTTGTSAAGPRT